MVSVVWRDASNSGYWDTLEDAMARSVAQVESCGHLVDSNDEFLLLAAGVSNTGMILSAQTIPAENILSVTELKEV
jgi:hypothetical protein